jgi:hypothetical protein
VPRLPPQNGGRGHERARPVLFVEIGYGKTTFERVIEYFVRERHRQPFESNQVDCVRQYVSGMTSAEALTGCAISAFQQPHNDFPCVLQLVIRRTILENAEKFVF